MFYLAVGAATARLAYTDCPVLWRDGSRLLPSSDRSIAAVSGLFWPLALPLVAIEAALPCEQDYR